MFENYNFRKFDFRLIALVLALDVVGVLSVSSATRGEMRFVSRQIMGIAIGVLFALAISLIPYIKMLKLAPYIYVASNILLVMILFFGNSVYGAKRWITLPVIGQIQGSEFVKIGLIMFFSWLLSKYKESINTVLFLFFYGLLSAVPLILVLREPDLSTTIVIAVSILCMLYVSGISYKWIFATLAVLIPTIGGYIWLLLNDHVPSFLRGYQSTRILAWLNPAKYEEAARQQMNAVMAIGSGQLTGKGLNNTTLASVKNGDFLSEEQTDFIFAVIGEEMGFVGSIVVISLFAFVVFECLYLAGRARDLQGKLICTGFAAIIAFQSFANISVNTRIFPNTGLTLPFISYGVSSLFSLHIGLGLVLNVGMSRE